MIIGPGEYDHKGPTHLYDISNHKPQVAKKGGYLETIHLQKFKKMPVFIIYNGSFAIFVEVYPLFSNQSLIKTAKM